MRDDVPMVDMARLDAWRSFTQANSVVVRALDREMHDELGLPLTWYEVLSRLSHSPEGRLRMQTLADSVVYSRSGITRLLDRMARSGLIQRQPCSHDRRGLYAAITPKGSELFQRARPGHIRRIESHFLRHLSDEDLAGLQKVLTKVVAAELSEAEVPTG
jgi:DNA-binding MarR family transcriptional regulator